MKFLPIVFAAALLGFTCLVSSCAAVGSAITGEPIHSTAVQRADGSGPAFEAATSDVVRAETATKPTVWGMYDAGAAAKRAGELIEYSGK